MTPEKDCTLWHLQKVISSVHCATLKTLSALVKEIHAFLLNYWALPLQLVPKRAFPHQLVGKRSKSSPISGETLIPH